MGNYQASNCSGDGPLRGRVSTANKARRGGMGVASSWTDRLDGCLIRCRWRIGGWP